MDKIRTISSTNRDIDEIKVDFPFEAVCPVPKKPFSGICRVSYKPVWTGETVELLEWNSLAEWAVESREFLYTAEDFAQRVLDLVSDATRSMDVMVEVRTTSPFYLPVVVRAKKGYKEGK